MVGLSETAFGKNDIRGIYGSEITEELFYYTGKGYIKYISEHSGKKPVDIWVTVARDARNHSPALSKALIKGITATGASVVDLGLAPTPIGYYSEVAGVNQAVTEGNEITGALIVTASHNPPRYNGLKMTFAGQSLNETQIKEVKELTFKEAKIDFIPSRIGKVKEYDLIPDYCGVMEKVFGKIGKGVKVVVDSGNATAGIIAPNLYRALGCDVVELYSNPNGNFPNHHPNPSDEKNLTEIKKVVVEAGADLGIAFDGDADRIGVIDSKGRYMTGDKLLLIYAQDIIKGLKGAGKKPIVVSEVKCSQVLYDEINANGGQAVMCKTGHGYIKGKMKETGAILAGEMSGHTFFKDKYYGFDDAVYAGCRIIQIVANNKTQNSDFKIEQLLAPFDKVYSSAEVRYPCANELKKDTLTAVKTAINKNPNFFNDTIKEIITLDGLRIVFNGGFALIRQSNTEPVFTLRFEAKDEKTSNMYQKAMIDELDKILNK